MAALRRTARRKTADLSAVPPAAIALGIALAIVPISVCAETKVRGTPQAVVVEAQNASVEEVLVALTDTFKVRFWSAANLDKRLTGTYQGTLRQAVSQILKGYHFVVKSGRAGLEITLLDTGKPVAVVGARPATKAAGAVPAAPQSTPTATVDDPPVPVPSLGGPTPPIGVAQGSGPVPTPPAPGTTGPRPVPQIGPGPAPAPMPAQPGATPAPVPPLPTASLTAPPTSPAPAPSPSRHMWVAQLIGESSGAVALSRFRQMQGKLRSALGSYEPAILRTTLKDGTIWVRVRVEFDSRQAAEALCSKLEAREPCLVQRNSDNAR
jgi:SPOR domain